MAIKQRILTDIHGLSDDRIHAFAPAIFATEAHESRSDKYLYIPTCDIIAKMRAEGFGITTIGQSITRDVGQRAYAKHLINFSPLESIEAVNRGRGKPESASVWLRNSHNGTSSYELFLGLVRILCQNGLFTGDWSKQTRIPHRGTIGKVVEGTLEVLGEAQKSLEQVEIMKSIQLSNEESLLLAQSAMTLRFEEGKDADGEVKEVPYHPASFLKARRFEDCKSDLWTVWNRIQENILKGGVTAVNSQGRRVTSRAVENVDDVPLLNKALYQLALGMAELKK